MKLENLPGALRAESRATLSEVMAHDPPPVSVAEIDRALPPHMRRALRELLARLRAEWIATGHSAGLSAAASMIEGAQK